nr:immunoglobulin light chain junction region [Macaca mulatta]MOW03414.1 immunoglobulin light chain junction region [Macaca mulatta]
DYYCAIWHSRTYMF